MCVCLYVECAGGVFMVPLNGVSLLLRTHTSYIYVHIYIQPNNSFLAAMHQSKLRFTFKGLVSTFGANKITYRGNRAGAKTGEAGEHSQTQ